MPLGERLTQVNAARCAFLPFALARGQAHRYVAPMPRFARTALVPTLAALTAACASTGTSGDYPSLAIRDAERAEGQIDAGEPARLDIPPVEVELSGGIDARLASLVSAAQEAHAEFVSVQPRAIRLVAGAGSVGSDSWAAAQVALAELDSARSRAAVPLADLDMIFAAARVAAEDTQAIEQARNTVIALVSEEDATLEELRSRIQ